MENKYLWADALNISADQIQAWINEKPKSENLVKWALQNKHISSKDYMAWAKSFYPFPSFKRTIQNWNYNLNFISMHSQIPSWSAHLVPVCEWDNVTFVACLEPPTQDLGTNIQFILASAEQLDELWGKFKTEEQMIGSPGVPALEFPVDHSAKSTESFVTVEKTDVTGMQPLAPEVKPESEIIDTPDESQFTGLDSSMQESDSGETLFQMDTNEIDNSDKLFTTEINTADEDELLFASEPNSNNEPEESDLPPIPDDDDNSGEGLFISDSKSPPKITFDFSPAEPQTESTEDQASKKAQVQTIETPSLESPEASSNEVEISEAQPHSKSPPEIPKFPEPKPEPKEILADKSVILQALPKADENSIVRPPPVHEYQIIFNQICKIYQTCFLLEPSSKNEYQVLASHNHQLNLDTKIKASGQKPHFLNLVSANKDYHGGIVQSEAHKSILSSLEIHNWPETVTCIKLGSQLLVGIGDQSCLDLDKLEFIKKKSSAFQQKTGLPTAA